MKFLLIKLEQKKADFCVCVYEQSVVSGDMTSLLLDAPSSRMCMCSSNIYL